MLNEFEDNKQELTLFLIELLRTIDLSKFPKDSSDGLKRYIVVAIKNHFYKLSSDYRYHQSYIKDYKSFEDYVEDYVGDYVGDYVIDDSDIDCISRIKKGVEKLSKKQRKVFIYKTVYGFSIKEIGRMLNISRQAVNSLYRRGTKILQEHYKENY